MSCWGGGGGDSKSGGMDAKTRALAEAAGAVGGAAGAAGGALKAGFLVKQGHVVKNWKKRWFVLRENKLEYYVDPRDKSSRGMIPLDDVTLSLTTDQAGKPNCFGIFHPDRKTYLIYADSDREMMEWVTAIRRDDKVGMIDFRVLAVLGKGNFGKVLLVKHKVSDKLYAMKVLSKEVVIRRNDVEHAKAERRILQKIRHPFIVQLHYAFQTGDKLYMVMDYVPGGDLYFHLRQHKRFPEELVRLWMAQLVLAIEYLHRLGIVYRDLKPENILLDPDGHLRMTDFGLSKIQDGDGPLHTFCGTPYYVAPEMLSKRRQYTKSVDWWSLGILCHELLVGQPPFYSNNMTRVYEKIVHSEIKFPPSVPAPAQGLIMALLQRDPSKRLGAGPTGAAEVKAHPYFDTLDFHEVLQKRIEMPYKPSIESATSTANFDSYFTNQRPADSTSATPAPAKGEANPFQDFSFAEKIERGNDLEDSSPLDAEADEVGRLLQAEAEASARESMTQPRDVEDLATYMGAGRCDNESHAVD